MTKTAQLRDWYQQHPKATPEAAANRFQCSTSLAYNVKHYGASSTPSQQRRHRTNGNGHPATSASFDLDRLVTHIRTKRDRLDALLAVFDGTEIKGLLSP